jgi:2-C-methyl-D-erythritol 2,4-cyclodiphosphate synthase
MNPKASSRSESGAQIRVGYGWDSHEFKSGIPLKIGGIEIPHAKGLGGHSDGDALLHAITDALLGAIAAPDIGTLFSPSDPKWKGADSSLFLSEALRRVNAAGFDLVNVDSTLILAQPKLAPHVHSIRQNLSKLLPITGDCIGIKAKTPEGIGTDNAAIAHAVVLLQRSPSRVSASGQSRSRSSKRHP